MADNKYCNLVGTNKIKDEYTLINDGFALVEADITDASPAGVYANIAALIAAIPAGDNKIYITTDNGYWNYWNGLAWTAGSLYQSPLTDSPANTIKGNNTAVAAPVKDLTVAQTKALLDIDDIETQLNSASVTGTSTALVKSLANTTTGVMSSLTVKGNTRSNFALNTWATSLTGWTSDEDSIEANKYRLTWTSYSQGYRSLATVLDLTKNYLITMQGIATSDTAQEGEHQTMFLYDSGASAYIKDCAIHLAAVDNKRIGIIVQASELTGTTPTLYVEHQGSGYTEYSQFFIQEITSAEYAEGLTVVMNRYPYRTSGTASTEPLETAVIGKNLFDGTWIVGGYYVAATGEITLNGDFYYSPNYIPVTVSDCTLSVAGLEIVGWSEMIFYDGNKQYISGFHQFGNSTFTVPLNAKYARVSGNIGTSNLATVQLELGSVATTYAPYQSTRFYTPILHSVPAIADTFDGVSGLHTQNVSLPYTLVADDIVIIDTGAANLDYVGFNKRSDSIEYEIASILIGTASYNGIGSKSGWVTYGGFNNVAAIGNLLTDGDGSHYYYGVVKGTYADLAAAKTALTGGVIYYQLATPTLSYYPPKSIPLEINSTIQHESIMSDIVFYSTGIAITDTDYPISALQEVFKVNEDTGIETPIDIATCTVAGGGLSFTSTALVNGDLVWYRYYHSVQSVTPTTDYVCTTSLAGGLAELQKNAQRTEDRLQKQIDELRAIIASMAV